MTVTATCFKWVDLLESQFDKSWIDLDSLLLQLEEDEEFSVLYNKSRRQVASLASCFSQLSHKATVVFQNNAKLEAELVNLRSELATTQATIDKLTREKAYLTSALQSSLAKNHQLQADAEAEVGTEVGTEVSGEEIVTVEDVQEVEDVEKTLMRNNGEKTNIGRDLHLCAALVTENTRLRGEVLELESEMVGARLDNVYLDKELAGRIQQIQLLLAANTPSEVKEKMWTQIEGEMCLQRSKTIAQMCRTKQEVRTRLAAEENVGNGVVKQAVESCEESQERRGKQVMVLKNPADDLGIAILGGQDHRLPIIISEIFPNSAVSRAKRIQAGDIIKGVNDEDFSNKTHSDAVNYLSALRGQILFDLKSVDEVSEDDPSNLDYRFYKIFHPYLCAKETGVEESLSLNHPGRAISVDSVKISNSPTELPSIHSSPKKGEGLT